MTKTSSHDPIDLYSRLDPTAGADTPTPDSEATVALFEKITTEVPRERHPAVAPKADRFRWTSTGVRLKRPMLVALPAMALLIAAVVVVSVISPIGTSSAVAEVKAAATSTAAFDRGRISSVFVAFDGDDRIGSSEIDYRYFNEDFDYRNTYDPDLIEHLEGVDLAELFKEQLEALGPIEIDDVGVEPETLIRSVAGVGYFHDGTSWSRGNVPGIDLGDVEGRSLAATHATDELTSCNGPSGFDSYCGTSDDLEVIAALLLTRPETFTSDTTAIIQINIDNTTGLVHTVQATLTSDRQAEVAGITRFEATVTLSDLGIGEAIEAPNLPAPSSTPVDLVIEVPGVEGTCRGSGSIDEARRAIADCLIAKGVEQSTAELIASSLD